MTQEELIQFAKDVYSLPDEIEWDLFGCCPCCGRNIHAEGCELVRLTQKSAEIYKQDQEETNVLPC